jgi:hypothetical protein
LLSKYQVSLSLSRGEEEMDAVWMIRCHRKEILGLLVYRPSTFTIIPAL